jgi:hypothetical protein
MLKIYFRRNPRKLDCSNRSKRNTSECLSGARILIANDETMTAMEMAGKMTGAGAVVVGPAATLAELHALLPKTNPTAVILSLYLGEADWASLMIELMERRLPTLFYRRASSPAQGLVLEGRVINPSEIAGGDLLPAISALLGSQWPTQLASRQSMAAR